MVVLVDGKPLPDLKDNSVVFMDAFYKEFDSTLGKAAREFRKKPVKHVSNKDITLYVDQHEYAVLCHDSSAVISKLGSDMATTCHIVTLYHKDTKVAAVAHFDGPAKASATDPVTKQGTTDMVHDMLKEIKQRIRMMDGEPESIIKLELNIVGGFCDKRDLSRMLSDHLLKDFDTFKSPEGFPPVQFELTMFCSSKWNNKKVEPDQEEPFNCWIVGGVVCDAKTGQIMPAQFDDDARTPVIARRGARCISGVELYPNIYSVQDNCFILRPYSYVSKPPEIPQLLSLSCAELKKEISTSPNAEASGFCLYTRASLKFIEDNPDPMKSVFSVGPLKLQAQIMDGLLTWQ